jgi:hypothetical protein
MSVASRAGPSSLLDYMVGDLGMTSQSIEDCLWEFYSSKGHTGSLSGMEYQYLTDAGYSHNHINDKWYAYLGDLGHVGTIWDRFYLSIIDKDLFGAIATDGVTWQGGDTSWQGDTNVVWRLAA